MVTQQEREDAILEEIHGTRPPYPFDGDRVVGPPDDSAAREHLRNVNPNSSAFGRSEGESLASGEEATRVETDAQALAPEPPEAGDELTGEELQERARELGIKGRSKMSSDELREAVAEAERS
jgi:hypothetical protein